MMRLAEIERHVASMEELQRIVGAMRAIASMRMQEAVRALASVRDYGNVLAAAVRDALAIAGEETRLAAGDGGPYPRATHEPAGRPGHRAIVLFASEHGFVGGFNQRLIDAVDPDLTASDLLMIVGSRGAALATERGHVPEWADSLATRLAGIPQTVQRLEQALLPRISRQEILCAEVVFGRCGHSGQLVIERHRLFPLQLAIAAGSQPRFPPLHDLSASQLLERLTAEYIRAQLTEAATEALAAENAARFTAMESARDNVGRKLRTLRLDASRARQEEVTTELLDLITGEQTASFP